MNLTDALVLVAGWCVVAVPAAVLAGRAIERANRLVLQAQADADAHVSRLVAESYRERVASAEQIATMTEQHRIDRAAADARLDTLMERADADRRHLAQALVATTSYPMARGLTMLQKADRGPIDPDERIDEILGDHDRRLADELPPGVVPVGAGV